MSHPWESNVTSLQRTCHIPGKAELTTLRPGDTSSSVLPPWACQALLALSIPALHCAQCPAPAALIFWEKLFPDVNDCSRTANDCSQMIMAVPSPAGHRAQIPLDKDTQSPRGEEENDSVCAHLGQVTHYPERNLLNAGHSRVSWIPEKRKSTLTLVIDSQWVQPCAHPCPKKPSHRNTSDLVF